MKTTLTRSEVTTGDVAYTTREYIDFMTRKPKLCLKQTRRFSKPTRAWCVTTVYTSGFTTITAFRSKDHAERWFNLIHH